MSEITKPDALPSIIPTSIIPTKPAPAPAPPPPRPPRGNFKRDKPMLRVLRPRRRG